MKRREFIALLGGAAAWPLAARAQQSQLPVIGFLGSASAIEYKPFVDAFFLGLKKEGYVLGENIVVEYRWADGQYDRLPRFAGELVRIHPNVIIAIAPPAARAAKAATSAIPIVFSAANDPVSLGLVASLNRPGGNLTGINFLAFEMVSKRIELLTKLLAANTIGMLVNQDNPSTARSKADAQKAADTLGKKLIVAGANTVRDIVLAFTQFVRQQVGAIAVEPDPFLLASREHVVAQATQYSMPAIYPHREFTDIGGLISYGADISDVYLQMGGYAGRILKGERPANLPVLQATKFELVVNLKTAKKLGLEVPPNIQQIADQIIE
jgi:putative ABC transport system substrate-binding protein